MSIVINGAGFEERADVYVSRAAIKWAVIQSMTKLYLIDGATGQPIEITDPAPPKSSSPQSSSSSWKKATPSSLRGVSSSPASPPEKVKELLATDPAVSGTYKIFLEGTSYTPGQAARGDHRYGLPHVRDQRGHDCSRDSHQSGQAACQEQQHFCQCHEHNQG